ncbi:hypothetical protein PV797_11185 [Clostridiaceae bacterium M8S5]|nr:hypothetical protein PV797_11185 [Clostridiaceae bacterium M8S5]
MEKKLVHINKENMLDYYMNHLNDNINYFKNIDGVAGLTLNGGLSRGYGDHLSEIDVTIYLDDDSYKNFKDGLLNVKEGICKIDTVLYDIKILNLRSENERSMNPITELWDLSYAKILFDPYGEIKKFVNEKLKHKDVIKHIEGIMFGAWWHFKLAGDIWIYREDQYQGHMMLNECVKSILQSLYLANDEYVPHEKWLSHLVRNLEWLPCDVDELLTGLYSTGDLSMDSLIQRQSFMNDIWDRINEYVIDKYYDGCPVDITKRTWFEKFSMLLTEDAMRLEDYKKEYGFIYSDPFTEIITIKEDMVYINKDKVMELDEDSMYEWQFDIVKAVQESLK